MGPLSRWAVLNPKKAVGIWVLAMVAIFGTAIGVGANYNDTFTLPNTESKKAQDILEAQFGAVGQEDTSAKVVFGPTTGTIEQESVKESMNELFTELRTVPAVKAITSPYDPAPSGGGAPAGDGENPAGTAGGFMSPISSDETVAYATVEFTPNEDGVVPFEEVNEFVAILEKANTPELQIGAAGSVIDFAGGEEPSSELIGVAVALLILLLMFGSVIAAGVPILSALIGLGTGLGLVTLATQFFDIATFAPTLAAMIGLGVGIDYSLFVINRYKTALDAGRDVRPAALEAVNTAGRAVLFAATTVTIALAGLFVLGIGFLNGLAIASMLGVLMVMLGALWLLPAVLSWMGPKAFAWKLPGRRTVKHHPNGTPMARYGNWLQKRPWVGFAALVIVFIVAIPTASLQQGFPDNGGKPAGSPAKIGYDLLTEGFGPGINGPFIVVAELPEAGDFDGVNALATAIQETDDVAGATNPFPDNAENPGEATAAIITVYPASSPQDEATATLLETLRDDVIPTATAGTGVLAYVGGAQAIVSDFGDVLADALPLFLMIVVGLGFLALTVLFRSIVVPLTAALTSLLSFAAALGVTVAVFQWGWFADFFGVESTGPIFPFLPVMVFAILFGLSMDYQVFLVSRMQEEWSHTKDNRASIRRGLAGSGRVVAAAGAIMFSVFVSFVFGDDATIKLFGLALSTAVLIDAFIVRLIFVPALMTVLGNANWWLPGWLDRILPTMTVEGGDNFEEEASLIEDIPDADDDLEPAGSR
jgi:RND superfamily putative drug exporter